MTTKTRLPLTGLALGVAGTLGHHYYYHQWLPRLRYRRLKQNAKRRGTVSGGWIDHRPQAISRGDVLGIGYTGGFIIDGVAYAFTVTDDGTLLRWQGA